MTLFVVLAIPGGKKKKTTNTYSGEKLESIPAGIAVRCSADSRRVFAENVAERDAESATLVSTVSFVIA
jgi:hypothetical protein